MKKTPPPAAARFAPRDDPSAINPHPSTASVEAVQWKGDRQEMNRFCGKQITQKTFSNRELWIVDQTETREVKRGDWVVKRDGKLSVMTNEKFVQRYEKR